MSEQSAVLTRPVTYQDVLDAPEHLVAEIIAGELHTHPRPRTRHGRVTLKLSSRLDRAFDDGIDGPGGWWIAEEPELHLGEDVLVPDICGWRRETLPALPDAAFIEVVPDWVCEVLSPSTRVTDLTTKRERYRVHGVGHLWLIDPETRILEVFGLVDRAWSLRLTAKDAEKVSAPPFDAISLDLSALWLPAPDGA
ncbi:MAG: Uma2 family endonuclease [Paracoccaceae bacterium]